MCFYIEGMGKDLQDCFSAYPVYRANSIYQYVPLKKRGGRGRKQSKNLLLCATVKKED